MPVDYAIRYEQRQRKVEDLVRSAERGFAVVVVGPDGSGKYAACMSAVGRMGLSQVTINAALLDMHDILGLYIPPSHGCSGASRTPSILESIMDGTALIIEDLHKMRKDMRRVFSLNLCEYVRRNFPGLPKKKKVVFILLPPDANQDEVLEDLAPAMGESLGLERLVVNFGV